MIDVLVVDDQPGIRLLLTDVLTNEGYEVDTAATGKEAVEKIEKEKYRLLILDYNLPILSGLDVIREIEKSEEKIPVILITGLATIDESVQSYPFVKKTVGKPFNIADICKEVNAILT